MNSAQSLEIFIPYWGSPAYMKETVESVLAQTNPHWTLVVVDDDYPGTEIEEYLAQLDDPRIRYIRKERNEGITENYRTCVAMASQPLIVLLGCDDRLLPNYVDVILAAHQRYPDAALIQPGVQVIDEDGVVGLNLNDGVKQKLMRPRGGGNQLVCGEALAVNLLHGDWLYWPSLAFRTDKISTVDFRDGYPVTQDFAIIMDMVFRGDQLLIVPDVCFQYRRHQSSASSLKLMDGSRFAAERSYYELAATLAQANGWRRAVRAARARLTSRAHALSLLPKAAATKDPKAAAMLVRHGLWT